jgi:hypothetical protein
VLTALPDFWDKKKRLWAIVPEVSNDPFFSETSETIRLTT